MDKLEVEWNFEVDFAKQRPSYIWVQLLEIFSPFSYEEALLLTKQSESQWVVWIPDYGEAIVMADQFCFPF